MQTGLRKAINLSLDEHLLAEAKVLKVNISRAAEDGLRDALSRARAAAWRAENADALESSNRYVEAHGLPLDRFRPF